MTGLIPLMLGASLLLTTPQAAEITQEDDLAPAPAVTLTTVQQRHQLLAPFLPSVLLQRFDDQPAYPWDPFVVVIQRGLYTIASIFFLSGCGCCIAGIIAGALSLSAGAPGSANKALNSVITVGNQALQATLVIASCLVFTPPTLLLWAGGVPWLIGAQFTDVMKSPRQHAIEAEQARIAAENQRMQQQQQQQQQQQNRYNQRSGAINGSNGYDDGYGNNPNNNDGHRNPYNGGGSNNGNGNNNNGRSPVVHGQPPADNNQHANPPPADNSRSPRAGPGGLHRSGDDEDRKRAEEERKKREEEERKKREEEERKRHVPNRGLPPPGFQK